MSYLPLAGSINNPSHTVTIEIIQLIKERKKEEKKTNLLYKGILHWEGVLLSQWFASKVIPNCSGKEDL